MYSFLHRLLEPYMLFSHLLKFMDIELHMNNFADLVRIYNLFAHDKNL